MKKITSSILTFVLALAVLMTGCKYVTSQAAPVKKLKVVLLIPGNLGDKSFFDSANHGMEMVKKQLGVETKVIEMGTDATKWEPMLKTVSGQDWNIIISGTWQMTDYLVSAAKAHPDKKYINFDTSDNQVTPNLYGMFYKTNESSFLAGAAASMITSSKLPHANPSKVIGFVGGMDNPGINDFLVGYIQGAKYVNKDIKVAVTFVGAFDNPAKGKEMALSLYNANADVVFQVAGGSGLGVLDAAKEKNAYAIGVDSDQAMLFKSVDNVKAQHIPTSAIKNIDLSIFRAVKMYKAGTLKFGKFDVLGIKDNGVGLAKNEFYNSTLTPDMKNKIKDIESKIVSGKIKVDTAFGLTTDQINKIKKSVQP